MVRLDQSQSLFVIEGPIRGPGCNGGLLVRPIVPSHVRVGTNGCSRPNVQIISPIRDSRLDYLLVAEWKMESVGRNVE